MFKGQKSDWNTLLKQFEALLEGPQEDITLMANGAALLHWYLEDINWLGFYLLREEKLILGPFQGLPACIEIALGRGVCGTAAQKRETMRIADVDQFPGHIACDSASRSELVIPLIKEDTLLGVLDIDSPLKDRFTQEDQLWLERAASHLASRLSTTSA